MLFSDRYEALQCEDDVHVLTGALKLFFRELSDSIFPISMNKEFMSAIRKFLNNFIKDLLFFIISIISLRKLVASLIVILRKEGKIKK